MDLAAAAAAASMARLRDHRAPAMRPACRAMHQRLAESLVHHIHRQPRTPVRHPHFFCRSSDRAGIRKRVRQIGHSVTENNAVTTERTPLQVYFCSHLAASDRKLHYRPPGGGMASGRGVRHIPPYMTMSSKASPMRPLPVTSSTLEVMPRLARD